MLPRSHSDEGRGVSGRDFEQDSPAYAVKPRRRALTFESREREQPVDIFIGSDPWARGLHGHCVKLCARWGHQVTQVSDPDGDGVPYYEIARRVAVRVSESVDSRGVVLCGTGMGVSMVANSFPGIRCALCEHPITAHRARIFNNANVLAMGEYFTTTTVAKDILHTFLQVPFGEDVDEDRLQEIREWHNAVRAMENRICRENWPERSQPEQVPVVKTEIER